SGASHHRAAAAEAPPADREPSLVRGLSRGHLGTGGNDGDGAGGSCGPGARRRAAVDRGSLGGPRDRRTGGSCPSEPRALRPERAPGTRARGDHMNRLHALTDGVFAIAMTLLVLELRVPDATNSSELISGLRMIVPNLFSFALGFAVCGTYWVGSAMNLSHLARVNRAALFLNVLQLFFISLLPFSTAILGRYPDEAAAVIVYALHL